MTALHTSFAFNGPVAIATPSAPLFNGTAKIAKNMLLFLVSPFVGLAYALLLPVVGFGMLLWIATEGLRRPAAKKVARIEPPVAASEAPVVRAEVATAAEEAHAHGFAGAALFTLKLVAAPFAGLAFAVLLPFAALGALAWVAVRSICVRTV